MEELQALKKILEEEHPMDWETYPDIGLYMDQVISYVGRQLITFDDGENLTPAMVNNYIKADLLPRAEGKKYTKTHLVHLVAICVLKQVLTVKETRALMTAGISDNQVERVYNIFCRELAQAQNNTAELLPEELSQEELPRLALQLALRSYADKLACQRILALMAEKKNVEPKKGVSKNLAQRAPHSF